MSVSQAAAVAVVLAGWAAGGRGYDVPFEPGNTLVRVGDRVDTLVLEPTPNGRWKTWVAVGDVTVLDVEVRRRPDGGPFDRVGRARVACTPLQTEVLRLIETRGGRIKPLVLDVAGRPDP